MIIHQDYRSSVGVIICSLKAMSRPTSGLTQQFSMTGSSTYNRGASSFSCDPSRLDVTQRASQQQGMRRTSQHVIRALKVLTRADPSSKRYLRLWKILLSPRFISQPSRQSNPYLPGAISVWLSSSLESRHVHIPVALAILVRSRTSSSSRLPSTLGHPRRPYNYLTQRPVRDGNLNFSTPNQ
ncbi:hypothetical protein VTI74DRAFT_1178 [Chaetomium olivicolor]